MTHKSCVAFIVTLSITALMGCSKSPKEHFKSNQSGVSPDYGVYYDGNLDDHVVTVHGFWDDYSVCMNIAELLKKQSDGESYSCRKLN